MGQQEGVVLMLVGVGGIGGALFDRILSAKQWARKPIQHLILVDYLPTSAKMEEAKTRLVNRCTKQLGIGCSLFHWDAADFASTNALCTALEKATDVPRPVDALILTTGMGYHGNVASVPLADTNRALQRLLQINCTGPSLLTTYVATRLMRSAEETSKSNGGVPPVVLLLSSYSGLVGLPDRAAYCASKFALNGFAESLYADLQHLRVILICPTTVATNFRDNWKKQLPQTGQGGTSTPLPTTTTTTSGTPPSTGPSGLTVMQRLTDASSSLSVVDCAERIYRVFDGGARSGPGVQYESLSGFFADLAMWLTRWRYIGDYSRYRILRKASKL